MGKRRCPRPINRHTSTKAAGCGGPRRSCNTPDVTFHICNSNSCHFRLCVMIFPPWLGFIFVFAFCSCHAFHIMSSCASHLHTCSSHASELFPHCPFCNPTRPHAPAHPPLVSFRERVLNVLGMDRGLSSGLGTRQGERKGSPDAL